MNGLQCNLSERDIRSLREAPGPLVPAPVCPGDVRRRRRAHSLRDGHPGGRGRGQVHPGGAGRQLPQVSQRQTGTGNTKNHQLLVRSGK